MNANQWPLEEMEQLVVTVPYPLEECVRRIEGIHQAKWRPPFFGLSLLIRRYPERRRRTAVARQLGHDAPNHYWVGRVWATLPYEARYTLVEVEVRLSPRGDHTTVQIAWTNQRSSVQKWAIGGTVGAGGLGLLFIIGSYFQNRDFPYALVCTLIWLGLIAAQLSYTYRQIQGSRTQLLTQIHQAFGVEYDPNTIKPK